MKNLKPFESETGSYKAPQFAVRPAAGDTGYAMVSKEFGATPGPKKKKKNQRTQEVAEDRGPDLGEIPGMGDSDKFPNMTTGYKKRDSELPADAIADPDEEKKKRYKNLKGYVEFIGGEKE